MSNDQQHYPVISEVELPEARKRFLGLWRSRDTSTLPPQRPGTALVFSTGRRWTQARERVAGTEDFVVDALAVSVVRIREHMVDVPLKIPSKDIADEHAVLVGFSCRVSKPELVAEVGPIDIVDRLRRYLLADRQLLQRGTQYTVEQLHEVRHSVDIRVRSYCDEVAPNIPGLEVKLSSVDVLSNADLVSHLKRMRTERWNYEFSMLTAQHEDGDVRRLSAYLKDPSSAAAFAFLREKIDMEKIVTAAYADRRTQDENLLEFLKLLERNGKIDLLPVDARVLVSRLLDRLGGTGGSLRVDAQIETEPPVTIDSEARASIDRAADLDDDRFVSDSA